jgi:putative membrane protein
MSQGTDMSKHNALQLFTALTLTCLVATGCDDADYEGTPPPNTDGNTFQGTGNDATGTAVLRDADSRILQTLHEKNLEEVAVGRMAQQKGAIEAVRDFGQRLVDDHTQNEEKVKALANELSVTLSGPTTKSAAEQALEPLTGAAFDERFATLMREGHDSLVQRVEMAQSEVGNDRIKAHLSETLPALRDHLRIAQELVGKVGRTDGQNQGGTQNPGGAGNSGNQNPPGGG